MHNGSLPAYPISRIAIRSADSRVSDSRESDSRCLSGLSDSSVSASRAYPLLPIRNVRIAMRG